MGGDWLLLAVTGHEVSVLRMHQLRAKEEIKSNCPAANPGLFRKLQWQMCVDRYLY